MKDNQTRSLPARLDDLPLNRWHGTLMTVCCLGLVFDAYNATILSVVMPKLVEEWHITPVEVGLLGSASFVGMLFGAIFFGILADRIGRWTVFQVTLLIYAVLTGACALSTGFTSMFILRVLVGFGLGGLVPVDSAYLAEYIPSRNRGQFLSWFNAFFQIGNALAYVAGFLVVVAPQGWKWGFILGVIPAFLLIYIRRNLPESVRYLVQKGQVPEAVRIVEGLEQRCIGKITVPYEKAVETEQSARASSSESKVRIIDLFKGGLAKSTIVISVLWFVANYSVYAIVVWFPILLMKQLGYGFAIGVSFLAIASVIGTIGQFSAGFACNYFGRRPTIAYSFLLFGVFGYLLFWLGKDPSVGSFLLIILMVFVGSTWGAVYAYSPENFPTRVRGTGVGFAGAVGRLGGILGPAVVGFIYAKAGVMWVLHINMALLVIAVVLMLILGTETKGKTLEEISEIELRA